MVVLYIAAQPIDRPRYYAHIFYDALQQSILGFYFDGENPIKHREVHIILIIGNILMCLMAMCQPLDQLKPID